MRSKVLTYMKRFGPAGITGANPVSKLHRELNSTGGKRGQDCLDQVLKELVEENRLIVVRERSRIVRIAFSKKELHANTPTNKEQKMTVVATSVEEQVPLGVNAAEELTAIETPAATKPDMLKDVNRGLKVLQAAANPEGVLPEGSLPYELIMAGTDLKKPRALLVNRHLGKLGVRTTSLGQSVVKMGVEVTLEQFSELQHADKQHRDEWKKQKSTTPATQAGIESTPSGEQQSAKESTSSSVEPELAPTLSEVLGGLVARVKTLEAERDALKIECDGLRTEKAQLKDELEMHRVGDELFEEAQRLLNV